MSQAPRDDIVGGLLVKNIATLFSARGMAMALSAMIPARYFRSEHLGRYGAVYAYLAFFSWPATFGIEPILSRDASQHCDRAGNRTCPRIGARRVS